jgi:hypothetical protein
MAGKAAVPSPLPLSALTAFAVCTGRILVHLQFDPATAAHAASVSFRAPLEIPFCVGTALA